MSITLTTNYSSLPSSVANVDEYLMADICKSVHQHLDSADKRFKSLSLSMRLLRYDQGLDSSRNLEGRQCAVPSSAGLVVWLCEIVK